MKDKKRQRGSTSPAPKLRAQRSKQPKAEQEKNVLVEDLNRSQQYFRALFNGIPSAVGISTVAEGRLCDVNEGFSRLTGYTREELIGRTTLELGLWADPSQREIVLREIREQGFVHNREGLLRTKSGEIRSLMVTVESIQLGTTPCLIYLAHDITERKRTEQQLRRSEQELADFFENATVGLHWVGPDGIILRANRTELDLLGYAADEYVGHHIVEFHADQSVIGDILKRLTAGEEFHDYEARLRCKDGSVRHVLISSNVLWEDGRFVHTRCFTRDITERKQAEVLLAAEKKVLELIATGTAMPEVLDTLMRETEAQSTDGMLCSILLLDESGQKLLHGAAPSLAPAFTAAAHGLVIGPYAGSCGTAAFERKPVFVTDIAADPRWAGAKDLAAAYGLGACHSTPILSSQGRLLGTIAMYYRGPHNPGAHDRQLIERATQLAGIAIERRQAEEALRLAKFSVDRAADAVYWIDPEAKVLDVNEAASRMLGYSKAELCAMTVHDLNPEFQADMWPGFWEETRKRGTMVIKTCHKAKNGRLIPIEVSVNFLSYEGKEYHCAFVRDITERKRGQDALSASEARFRSLVSNLPGAVYRCACDSDWTMEFLSDPIEDLCGYPASDFLASRVRSYNSVIHPNDRQMVARVILDAVAQRRPYTIEYRLLHKDGGTRWVHEKGQGIFAADGLVLWLDGAIFDITERKRTDEALRRSEAFITSVVENLPLMIFVKNAKDLTFVRFNKAGEELLGHSREALMGKSDYDFFPKEEADFFTQTDRQVLQTGGLLDIAEEVIETKHHGPRILHTRKIPIYDDTGKPRYLLGISEDITERKRTEDALKKSEDRYRSIFEKAVEGIFQTTPDGTYVAVNPALARIYGYDSPDDMIATITDIASQLYVDPGRRDEFLHAMQAQKEVTGFEALVYRKDGSFIWISESARMLRDQAGTVVGYEGTVEDITERKRAEGRLRATLDRVRTLSRRLATIQEEERAHIAREMHDELGVRLTCLKIDLSRVMSIVGHRVRADLRAKLNDRVRSMIGQVDSTIASVQQLVTQLRPTLLDDLGLVAAIEWQSQDFQKRTGIPCTYVTNADDIEMKPERATAVFRICQEALTNTARHAQATAVMIQLFLQPDSLQMMVTDNGVGISDTKTLDRRSLGLMGMQERATQCGGTVTIEGDPDKGTTVTLCLPVG